MKKLVLISAVLMMATSVFAQGRSNADAMDLASDGLNSKKIEKGMVENATPENSVLVFFTTDSGAKFWFKDTKSDWEVTVESDFISVCLPPVPKGANVKLIQGGMWKRGQYDTATTQTNIFTWCPVTDNNEFAFKAPKDKPLLFLGMHSILLAGNNTYEGYLAAWGKYSSENNAIGGGNITREQYELVRLQAEEKALKNAAKKYKKTAWEPVIKARLDELKVEIKNKKGK